MFRKFRALRSLSFFAVFVFCWPVLSLAGDVVIFGDSQHDQKVQQAIVEAAVFLKPDCCL